MSEWTEPKYCALCGHPESLCVCSASACNYCATEHGHRCPEANTKIYQLEARCRELEGDFRQALEVISDYYWAQSRKAGQKVDARARGFLADMNAKHAVLLSGSTLETGTKP